jgi:hypothetical protein
MLIDHERHDFESVLFKIASYAVPRILGFELRERSIGDGIDKDTILMIRAESDLFSDMRLE